jgi:hypothetical protein
VPRSTTTLQRTATATRNIGTVAVLTPTRSGAGATSAPAGNSSSPLPGGNGLSSLSGGNGSPTPGRTSANLFPSSSGAPGTAAAVTLRSSRPFITLHGPKARRSTILRFRLGHAGRVRFTVVQVSPFCRVVGSFTRRGHAGANRVRFNGRLHGHQLPAGTYQIGLRTRRGRVLRITLVIFDSAFSSPAAVAAARQRNVCGANAALAAQSAFAPLEPFAAAGFVLAGAGGTSAPAVPPSTPRSDHVLGSTFTGLPPQNFAKEIGKNPLAIVALGLAVLLLGTATIPEIVTPNGRAVDLIARRRSILMLAGAGALVAGVIAVALG